MARLTLAVSHSTLTGAPNDWMEITDRGAVAILFSVFASALAALADSRVRRLRSAATL